MEEIIEKKLKEWFENNTQVDFQEVAKFLEDEGFDFTGISAQELSLALIKFARENNYQAIQGSFCKDCGKQHINYPLKIYNICENCFHLIFFNDRNSLTLSLVKNSQ